MQRNTEAVDEAGRTKTIHKVKTDEIKAQFQAEICNKAVDYDFNNTGGITAELHGRTAETANIGIAIREYHDPQSF